MSACSGTTTHIRYPWLAAPPAGFQQCPVTALAPEDVSAEAAASVADPDSIPVWCEGPVIANPSLEPPPLQCSAPTRRTSLMMPKPIACRASSARQPSRKPARAHLCPVLSLHERSATSWAAARARRRARMQPVAGRKPQAQVSVRPDVVHAHMLGAMAGTPGTCCSCRAVGVGRAGPDLKVSEASRRRPVSCDCDGV